jgi:hypothetical protein
LPFYRLCGLISDIKFRQCKNPFSQSAFQHWSR